MSGGVWVLGAIAVVSAAVGGVAGCVIGWLLRARLVLVLVAGVVVLGVGIWQALT